MPIDEFIKWKTKNNIVPLKFDKKEKVLLALCNLEQSWIGIVDIMFINTFFMEAIQLVINAIVLFEEGYFDCAFYSLRQSLEISTTAVYLTDEDYNIHREKIKKWMREEEFPMYGQMIRRLIKYGKNFSDIQRNMASYFEDIKRIKKSLDKYVHKQGYDKLYIAINHPFNDRKERQKEKIVLDFELFLKKSIGAIAILRLSIDPLPVLLMDDEIYNRLPELLTEPFTDDFINEYIGKENIEAYKRTNLYKNYYDSIIKNEEMLSSVVDLVKHQYINRKKIDEILRQKHLLSERDLIAVLLAKYSNKISKIYCIGGLYWYHTDIHTKRKRHDLNSQDFTPDKFKVKEYNIPYDEVFLSYIKVNGEDYYIEHNLEFSEEEIVYLKELKFLS